MERVTLQPARLRDASPIADLIREQSDGCCLPVPIARILRALDKFVVARLHGEVVGCAALQVSEGLGELRCLVVAPRARGLGLGRLLVERIAARADSRRVELRCVTTQPDYFERLGFQLLPWVEPPARDRAPRGRVVMERIRQEATCVS